MTTRKPSEIVLFSNGETLEDLFLQGAGVFSVEQMTAMLKVFNNPVKPTTQKAVVYNISDYRR